MDHKAWPWKKKPSEKSLVVADKVTLCQKGNEEEIQTLQSGKVELERKMKSLKENLSSALSECSAKDDLIKRNAKMAKEALEGWEKVESEAMTLKQQLGEVLHQKVAADDRINNLDMALKECMQQLRFVRDEQEQRIHDAVIKVSREYEKARLFLEENLANVNIRLSKLGMENAQLTNALLAKEKLIEDISKQKNRVEDDFNMLMTRLGSTEKENASLKYEIQVLEKEVEIRNEEREFNRRTDESAHKQHLENAKKIAKLESECQRLRVLVRKRLPGPAALAKMRSEVEILGRDRRKSNLSSTGSVETDTENDHDTPRNKINFLAEQLCVMEEENRSLKEALDKQTTELQFSQVMYNHAASKLSRIESQIESSSVGQITSVSELGSDDKVYSPGSRSSMFFSEFENIQNGSQVRTPSQKSVVGAADIDLMDDFVEMEKLATISRNEPPKESSEVDSSDRIYGDENLLKKKTDHVNSNLSKSIQKVIDLIEGIGLPSKDSEAFGYAVRVFQWKTSELSVVLREFNQSCKDLLVGKSDFEKFAQDLSSALKWIINHCFSLQDVSSMKDAIKKQFDWDETRSENELESGRICQFSEADKLRSSREQFSCSPMSVWSDHKVEETKNDNRENSQKRKDDVENIKSQPLIKDLEGILGSEISKNEFLVIQVQESEKTIESLETERPFLKKSEGTIQHHSGDNVVDETKEDDKAYCCKELKDTSLESQILLESVAHEENPEEAVDQNKKQLRSDLEITAASEKLAECQETILNLGKQLKALAPPQDSDLFDKPIIDSEDTNTTPITQHCSLLDKMLAEDNADDSSFNVPKTEEVICISDPRKSSSNDNVISVPNDKYESLNGSKDNNDDENLGSFMALVPSKKKGRGGLLKKLLGRTKKPK